MAEGLFKIVGGLQMGDRGNIVVRSAFGDVWMYTHWNGTGMKDVLQTVLAKHQRWDDAPYLTRMIFCELVKDSEGNSTGFGISTHMLDNEHGVLVVDVTQQRVCRMEESGLVGNPKRLPVQLDMRVSRTFEEYAVNGFKKRVERRFQNYLRRKPQPFDYSILDRRKVHGRRKAD
jgi:hypothetical protein